MEKYVYKVVFEGFEQPDCSLSNTTRYYKSTSVSELLYWLSYNGASTGSIVLIERINEAPNHAVILRACD